MTLAFYYDISCPYAYLASRQIETLAAHHGATLEWRPILLGGVFKALGSGDGPMASFAPAKAMVNAQDMIRQAQRWGVPLEVPAGHPQRTVEAMRLIVAAPEALRPALTHALYRAYWVEGRPVSAPETVAQIAREHGLDPAIATTAEAKAALRARTDEALERGVFGVPAVFVDDVLYWGADRLHLAAGALSGTRHTPAQLQGPPSPVVALAEPSRVRVFHDFSSPFSYLGCSNVAQIAAQAGATVEWMPMLLGALFHTIGTPMVPMSTFSPPKTRYYARDLNDWATWWDTPFRFTSHFPLRTVAALRVALQEPATTPCLYEAAWVDDLDISDGEVLIEVLDEAGFDGTALLRGTQEAHIKAQLRANTDEARALGACGAPTFIVERAGLEPVMLWGQDRLPMVADLLAGWVPDGA